MGFSWRSENFITIRIIVLFFDLKAVEKLFKFATLVLHVVMAVKEKVRKRYRNLCA